MPTHNSAAKSARLSKEKHPEFYCPNSRCLVRTYDARTDTFTPCWKGSGHGLHINAVKREDGSVGQYFGWNGKVV